MFVLQGAVFWYYKIRMNECMFMNKTDLSKSYLDRDEGNDSMTNLPYNCRQCGKRRYADFCSFLK